MEAIPRINIHPDFQNSTEFLSLYVPGFLPLSLNALRIFFINKEISWSDATTSNEIKYQSNLNFHISIQISEGKYKCVANGQNILYTFSFYYMVFGLRTQPKFDELLHSVIFEFSHS